MTILAGDKKSWSLASERYYHARAEKRSTITHELRARTQVVSEMKTVRRDLYEWQKKQVSCKLKFTSLNSQGRRSAVRFTDWLSRRIFLKWSGSDPPPPALRPGFPKEDYQEREAKKEAERDANGGAPSMGSGRAAGFAQNPVAMDGATIMLAGGGVRRPGSGGTANIVVDPRNEFAINFL